MTKIFDYALDMERQGEEFYRKMGEQTANKGLQKVCNRLADEEAKHFAWVEAMRARAIPEVEGGTFHKDVKTIFESLDPKEEAGKLQGQNEQIALYKKALELEKKSRDFYRRKKKEASTVQAEQLLERLAREEETHAKILESIIEFVSKPQPGNWLENAEWYHHDKY